jgi:hypothetical protein
MTDRLQEKNKDLLEALAPFWRVLGICRGLDIWPDVGHRETLVLFTGTGRAFPEVLFALVKGSFFSAVDANVFAGSDFLTCIV